MPCLSHCSPERWVFRPGETYAEDTSKGEQDAATTQDACRDRWHSLEREACQCAESSPLPSPTSRTAWEGVDSLFWELMPSEFEISAEGRDSSFQWSLPRIQTLSLASPFLRDLEHTTALSLRLVVCERAEKSLSSSLIQKVRTITLQLNARRYRSPSILPNLSSSWAR